MIFHTLGANGEFGNDEMLWTGYMAISISTDNRKSLVIYKKLFRVLQETFRIHFKDPQETHRYLQGESHDHIWPKRLPTIS